MASMQHLSSELIGKFDFIVTFDVMPEDLKQAIKIADEFNVS